MRVAPAVLAEALTVSDPGGRRILDGLTLSVAPGERVLIVGPSGSGKSTLLRAIAGVPPTAGLTFVGSLRVAGIEVVGRSMTQVPRATGWLPQDPAAAVCLPVVEDDVAFPCENRAIAVDRIDRLVTAALDRAEAAGLRKADTATLSDGQAQRIGLAVATAAEPAVLVLDEPTSMLDPMGVLAVHGAVRDLHHLGGDAAAGRQAPALLLVEHRLDDLVGAVTFAGLPERTVVLLDGRVIADGSTQSVLLSSAELLHRTGCWLPWQSELASLRRAGSAADRGTSENHPTPAAALPAIRRLAAPSPPAPNITARHRRRTGPGRHTGTGEVLLVAAAVTVGYREPVLSGVDLVIRAGELIAVVGANGSGKSTLLRALAGLRKPLRGSTTWPGGRPALVFQNPEHQFVAASVRQELAAGGREPAVVEAALRQHRLVRVADLSPFRLSGGEKRRLSLAAVLIGDRRVVLADEPMFGLDRRDTRDVQRELCRAAAEGRAVLFSCHDLRMVAELATRLLVVAGGRLIADGPPLTLLRDPVLRHAAGLRLPPLLDVLFTEFDDAAARNILTALAGSIVSGRIPIVGPAASSAPAPP